MINCFFVADLHGHTDRYQKLFKVIAEEKPKMVFLGGDLFPSGLMALTSLDFKHQDFVNDVLVKGFSKLQEQLGEEYPQVFLILGNDDGRFEEMTILDAATRKIWVYAHNRKIKVSFDNNMYHVYGYSYIPPTPFQLKDWERYDVSRYVDPGCSSPEGGYHSVPVAENELKYATIQKDLQQLAGKDDLEKAIFLFHSPPYKTNLDRAALDGKMIDHVPVDVHVGSIAIQRFIKSRQPLLTLHGHVHESARLTGHWQEKMGKTYAFSAAHDGPELALVRFDLENLETANRELI